MQQFIATGKLTGGRRQETLDLLSCAPVRKFMCQVVGSPMKAYCDDCQCVNENIKKCIKY